MDIYFILLFIEYGKKSVVQRYPIDCSYGVFGILEKNKNIIIINECIANLSSVKDKKDATLVLLNLFHKANNGLPIHEQYDKKDFHEAHKFKRTKSDGKTVTEKIWRIRKGDIRLYLVFLPERKIILLKIYHKTDKLDKSRLKELELLAVEVLKYEDHSLFMERIFSCQKDN